MTSYSKMSAFEDYRPPHADRRTVKPHVHPVPTRYQLFTYYIRLWVFKIYVYFGQRILRWTQRQEADAARPTFTKGYSIRGTQLICRIFVPRACENLENSPMYLNLHGGGFVTGEAWEGMDY